MTDSISYTLGFAIGYNILIIVLGIIAICLAKRLFLPWILYIIGLAVTAISHVATYLGGSINYVALILSIILAILFLVLIIKRKNTARKKAKALNAMVKENEKAKAMEKNAD